MNKPALAALFFLWILVLSCGTSPKSGKKGDNTPNGSGQSIFTLDELRSQVEKGSPASLNRAAELLKEQELQSSEQGRVLGFIAAAIAQSLYPGLAVTAMEAPGSSAYTRIIREALQGVYLAPSSSSRDFFECVLPFLAFYSEDASVQINTAGLRNAIPHLERASRLNDDSVLPPLFRAYALEKTGEIVQAAAAYNQALGLDGSCYPAELGLARILQSQGRLDEAQAQLNVLLRRYPENPSVRKQLARLYSEQRDWQQADALIQRILAQNSRDGEFLLLRAKNLLDQGFFQQAQQPLDAYAAIDSASRRYILLRARLQAEGLRSREGAINLLRPLVRQDSNDPEAALYLASLLMESTRNEDVEEGSRLLNRFLGSANTSPEALSLAVADSIRRENWREAKTYLDRLLSRRQTNADLLNAWKTERALGNNAAALSHARGLYNRENPDDEAVSAYVLSLIDTGRQAEASRIIDQRLGSVPGGLRKSRYYYLRSRVRNDDDAILNDLRSALFEDPRNLDALIAMFEMYHRRKDERRAVYYLKQALDLAPDSPVLKRYEREYR